MAVEDATDGVGHWFIEVVAFDEDGEEAGYAAGADAWAGAFEEAWEFGKHAGWVAAGGWGFACCEADFAESEAEAGDAVHQEEDGSALVAEVFGDGHGGVSGFSAEECGLIGRCDDDDGSCEGRSQVILDELADFAAAFADQGEDNDVALGLLGEHGQQGGFADA